MNVSEHEPAESGLIVQPVVPLPVIVIEPVGVPDPGDVTATDAATVTLWPTTDGSGRSLLIETEVDALLTVSASGVTGTEGSASYAVAPVPVDAAAIKATSTPAYQTSPYGVASVCTNPN